MRLENWNLCLSLNGNLLIHGEIHDDEKGRWEDGTIINTSRVVVANFKENYVETLNSRYELGKRAE